jgi:hypothetical protein
MVKKADRVETFFFQLNKTIKQLLTTIEQAILTIPKLVLAALAEFEILFIILQVFLVGLVWMWIGTFLLHHMKILRFILNVLNDYAIIVSYIYGLLADAAEEAFNIASKAIWWLSAFTVDVGSIPITKFPVLNFEHFIKSLDGINDATKLCEPFKSVTFELAFPLRYALNNQVCPVVRFMTGTIVYRPFAWILSLFYFNADPADEINHNCTEIEAQYICFILKFGNVLIYIITPLMILSWLWPWISGLLHAIYELIKDVVVLAAEFIFDAMHIIFHRSEAKKLHHL